MWYNRLNEQNGKKGAELSEYAIQQRLYRTIKRAQTELSTPKCMYRVIRLNDPTCPFHLERFRLAHDRGDEILKVRIALDCVSDDDKKLCENFIMPGRMFTKCIMCKKAGGKDFEYWFFADGNVWNKGQ